MRPLGAEDGRGDAPDSDGGSGESGVEGETIGGDPLIGTTPGEYPGCPDPDEESAPVFNGGRCVDWG